MANTDKSMAPAVRGDLLPGLSIDGPKRAQALTLLYVINSIGIFRSFSRAQALFFGKSPLPAVASSNAVPIVHSPRVDH